MSFKVRQIRSPAGPHFPLSLESWLWFSGSVMPNSLVTPWPVAHQAPPSVGFPRQECWSGVPLLSPGALPYLVSPCPLHWQAGSLPCSHQGRP